MRINAPAIQWVPQEQLQEVRVRFQFTCMDANANHAQELSHEAVSRGYIRVYMRI